MKNKLNKIKTLINLLGVFAATAHSAEGANSWGLAR